MNTFDDILAAYQRHIQLPWANDVPPAGRVWIVWYEKTLQRRFTGRLSEFEHATLKAGHGWRELGLSRWFGRWIAEHELFPALVEQPKELRGLLPEIEDGLVSKMRQALNDCSPSDILAVDGCGALFGLARVSTLIAKIADRGTRPAAHRLSRKTFKWRLSPARCAGRMELSRRPYSPRKRTMRLKTC